MSEHGDEFNARETARRLVFQARQADEHNARGYDRARTAGVFEGQRIAGKAMGGIVPAKPMLDGMPAEFARLVPYASGGEPAALLSRVSDDPADEFASVMQTQSGRLFARAEAVLQSICRDETGQHETPERTRERLSNEAKLKWQASVVCDALEAQGVPAYRSDGWNLKIFGVHSHEWTDIPAYRRVCLNPYIGHRLRLPVLNWLQYFSQGRENALRFWTFTTGKRVPIHRLAARIKWLHRRLSELNAQPFMVKSGVRIVFRSTEFGTLEKNTRKQKKGRHQALADADEIGGNVEGGKGGVWYHPHAHCVVWLSRGPLRPWRWEELLRRVWQFWGHNWDEGKQIRDMRECVKYVVKPGDMVRLAQENPAELAHLHRILYRKKLVQPMDELQAQMRAADVAGLRPVLRWKNDVQKWTLERDPNRNPIADGSEASGLYGSDGCPSDPRAKFDDARKPIERTEMTRTAAERYFKRNAYGVKAAELDVCRVVARCVPAYNSRGIKEPRVVVMGTQFDSAAILAHPLVRRMVSATEAAYREGERNQAREIGGLALLGETAAERGGSDIRVHTGTPTVEERSAFDPGPMLWDPAEAHDPEILAALAQIA